MFKQKYHNITIFLSFLTHERDFCFGLVHFFFFFLMF